MEKTKLEVVRPYGESEIEAHAAKVNGRRNLRELSIVTDDGFEYRYLVKMPGRAVVNAIMQYESKKDFAGQQKVMLGCVLEGDKAAYEFDGRIYGELIVQIGEMANGVKGSIKKL